MCFAVHEGRDHIAESAEREIDFGGLFHAIPSGSSLAGSLRTGEIHKVEFGGLVLLVALFIVFLGVDVDGENAVRP